MSQREAMPLGCLYSQVWLRKTINTNTKIQQIWGYKNSIKTSTVFLHICHEEKNEIERVHFSATSKRILNTKFRK